MASYYVWCFEAIFKFWAGKSLGLEAEANGYSAIKVSFIFPETKESLSFFLSCTLLLSLKFDSAKRDFTTHSFSFDSPTTKSSAKLGTEHVFDTVRRFH